MDRSDIYHDANQDNNAGQGHNTNMYPHSNIHNTQALYNIAFEHWKFLQSEALHQQQLSESGDPVPVPDPQHSVCTVNITHTSPMTYVDRVHTDDLPQPIMDKIHMMLVEYTGAERTPPASRGPERSQTFHQWVRNHAAVREMYITDAENLEAFSCHVRVSEEALNMEPYASMPKIGLRLSDPQITMLSWLRFLRVDLELTDCKNPRRKEAEASGFYTTVSELEGGCAGARLLRLLTDSQAFTGLDIINLYITERFCAGDKNRSLNLYRSAAFFVRAKHVDVKVRWFDHPWDAFEMDYHPRLKEIVCPQLRGRNNSTPSPWQRSYMG